MSREAGVPVTTLETPFAGAARDERPFRTSWSKQGAESKDGPGLGAATGDGRAASSATQRLGAGA